jgi:hypothetical protein
VKLRLKCEHCGAKKATFKLCKKCGRPNPCPVKKLIFQITAPIMVIAILAGAVWSANWVAKFRADQAMSNATSFVVPREPKASGSNRGGGGRGARDLNWR